jgi:hypothetical protein
VFNQDRTEYGNETEEHCKNNRQIEDQTLHTTPGLEDGTSATAAKDAAESCATYLQQDKNHNDYAQDNFNDLESRKPLLTQE